MTQSDPQPIPSTDTPAWLPVPMPLTKHTWPPGTKPVVSVCCITYNHKDFIAGAIAGFLRQETTFPVEILINDDASTDGTDSIVRDYQARHAGLIRAILQTENQYVKGELILAKLMLAARGKYIAICEGDDYWICNQKLQRQVEYMDQHANVVLCCHDAYTEAVNPVTQAVERTPFHQTPPRSLLVFEDFATGYCPHTASCLVVNKMHIFSLLVQRKLRFATTIYYALLADGAMAAFLPNIMSVYRIHAGGVFSCIGNEKQLLMHNGALWSNRRYFTRRNQRALFTDRLLANYIYLLHSHLHSRRIKQSLLDVWAILRLLFIPLSVTSISIVTRRLYLRIKGLGVK